MPGFYVLARHDKSIGPSFNEAAEMLKAHPVIGYVDGYSAPGGKSGVIIAQADDAGAAELRTSLPDWTIAKAPPQPKG